MGWRRPYRKLPRGGAAQLARVGGCFLLGQALCLGSMLEARAQTQGKSEAKASGKSHDPAKATASAKTQADDAGQPQAPATAKELLQRFRKLQGLEAEFVERKKLSLLQAPLVSKGVLYYRRPGQLARRMLSPEPSLVRIVPGQLELEGPDGRQQIQLRNRPALQLFVEAFAKVLAGDHQALRQHFHVRYEARAGGHWVLGLRPQGPPLNQLVNELSVEGQGDRVQRLSVLEHSGDKTVTEFTRVDPQRRFSPEEVRRWFTIGAPSPGTKPQP